MTEEVVLGTMVFCRIFVPEWILQFYHYGLTFLSTDVATMTSEMFFHLI